tara:strand:- start:63 stop:728 length:666 start_codon:yes stop_codon:yes gene_type:complete
MKTLIPLLVFCLVAICNAELRTWTSIVGTKVEAELVSLTGNQVTLKTKAGKTLKLPLNKLSKADQEFLKAKPSPKEPTKGEVGVKTADSKIAGYWVSDVKLTIKNLKALKASSSDDFEKRIYGENIESLEMGVGLEQMPLTLQSKTIIKIEDNGKMIIFMNDSKQVGTYSTKSSSKIIGNLGGRFSMTLDGEALRMMPLGQLDLETGFLPVMFSRTSPPVD